MLEEYVEDQPIAYKIMKNTIVKDRLSHAYIIESNGYSRKNELALAFSKYLICPFHHTSLLETETCHICSTIDTQNLVDLKIIRPDGMWIKKNQMDDLQKEFGKKSLEGNKRIYIVESADMFNISSSNSILKFLEEPEEDIVAILVVDNLYQLIPTIISRCQIINLKGDIYQEKVLNTTQKLAQLFQINIDLEKNKEILIEKINKIVSFVTYFEKTPQSIHLHLQKLWFQTYSSKEDMQLGLEMMIYLYKDILNKLCEREIEIFDGYKTNIAEIVDSNTIDTICDKINIIVEIKDSIKMNLNLNLVMDKLIAKLKEV